MIIQHNVPAMNAQRRTNINTSLVSKSLEKLSSGYRINRAADDAAGLAISEKMRAQIRGLDQSSRNAQDGISLIQTAEGALQGTHDMLQRIRELADQSANGTNTQEERDAMQKEVNNLLEEITSSAEKTEFNTMKLLNGHLAGPNGGSSSGSVVTGAQTVRIDPATTGALTSTDPAPLAAFGKEYLVIDGAEIEVDWGALDADAKSAISAGTSINADAAASKKAAQAIQDHINRAIAESGFSTSQVTVSSSSPRQFVIESGLENDLRSKIVSFGNDQTRTTPNNTTGLSAWFAPSSVSSTASMTLAQEFFSVGGHQFSVDWSALPPADQAVITSGTAPTATAAQSAAAATIMQREMNAAITNASLDSVLGGPNPVVITSSGAGQFRIMCSGQFEYPSGGIVSYGSSVAVPDTAAGFASCLAAATPLLTSGVDATNAYKGTTFDTADIFVMKIGDTRYNVAGFPATSGVTTIDQLVIDLQSAIDNVIAGYNSVASPDDRFGAASVVVSRTNDGRLTITNNSGKDISFFDVEGSNKSPARELGISDALTNGGSGGGLTLQIGANKGQTMSFSIGDMRSAALGMAGVRLLTQSGAADALKTCDNAIKRVSEQRSILGAVQNRLEYTIDNLNATSENLTESESRIRDTDMAKEMMMFTKNNILVQAAQAMLAQANQTPQGVLQLLR